MAKMLEILTIPNPQLRIKAAEFPEFEIASKKTRELVKNMIKTMRAGDGIGLAATQAGVDRRVFVIGKEAVKDQNKETKKTIGAAGDIALFNVKYIPEIPEKGWLMEGCLSVPGIFGEVERFIKIKVEAVNENGRKISFTAENFFARVIQHESDHLDGVLFIDKAKNIIQSND